MIGARRAVPLGASAGPAGQPSPFCTLENHMGIGGISIWQLLIILAIVLLLFGTKRLRNLGTDLGNAIKGFRGALNDADQEQDQNTNQNRPELAGNKPQSQEKVINPDPAARDRDRV
jgi:sec-independent protein translocase protein TatA